MQLFRIFEQFPRLAVHPKTWGYEVWFFNTEELCMKLLVIYPGYTCSDHYHDKKYEIFTVLDSDWEGQVIMSLDGEQKSLGRGDHVVIQRGMVHSFHVRGTHPGSLLEVSTKHLEDDSYRIASSRLLNLGGKNMEGEVGLFHGKNVLCVGDLMYDTYWEGPSVGLSPEAPCAEVLNPQERARPGGLGNVASNVLSLGGNAIVVGAIGMDQRGENLKNMMEDEGADLKYLVEIPDRPTTTKMRIMTGGHHHVRLSFEKKDDIKGKYCVSLETRFKSALEDEKPDVIYLADYDKGVLSEEFLEYIRDLLEGSNIITVADPKISHPWMFKNVTVYKPNIGRLSTTLGRDIETESDLFEAAKEINFRVFPQYTLITKGPHGMSLFKGDNLVKHIPGKVVQISELTGAGDTVGAVLSLALAAGLPIERAAEIANVAGSLVVQKPGTANCTPFELQDALGSP